MSHLSHEPEYHVSNGDGVSRLGRLWADPLLGAALAGELLLLWGLNYCDLSGNGHLGRFAALLLAAGLCYWVAAVRFDAVRRAWKPGLLWSVAVGLRLAVLFLPPADDFQANLLDGKLHLDGVNLYLIRGWWSPAWLDSIASGSGDLTAEVAAPGILWIFAHLAGAAGHYGVSPAFLPLFLRGVFAVADLGTIWLLLKLNTGSGRYQATSWYAWNPAVAVAFAGLGLCGSVMLLALSASALMLHRANPLGLCKPAWSWSLLSALLLGVALTFTPMAALLLLPVWAFALGRRAAALLAAGVASLLLGVMAIPDFSNWKLYLLLGLAFVFRNDWRRGALWVTGVGLLLLTPSFGPWDAIWILPLACWRKAHAWFLFSLTSLLALLPQFARSNPLAWERLLIFGPPLLWGAFVYYNGIKHREAKEPKAARLA